MGERILVLRNGGHKAYPDEKGTESMGDLAHAPVGLGHKAYPDEKGTERQTDTGANNIEGLVVTRHIPMKRELKED